MTEKVKNSAGLGRMKTVPFLALWTTSNIASWLFTLWLWETARLGGSGLVVNALMVSVLPGMIAAVGHRWLIERGLKKSARNWLPVTFVGQLLSAAAYYLYVDNTRFTTSSPAMMLVFLFMPVALLQASWLHSRVKSAWLWVVGAVISAIVFALPIQNPNITSDFAAYVFLAAAAVLQGVVTSSVMLHLWSQERETEKDKSTGFQASAFNARAGEAYARLHETVIEDAQPDAEPAQHQEETRS